MYTLRTGNMWDVLGSADLFCITTNSFVKHNGELVMGRGIARDARDRFPGLASEFGLAIRKSCGSLGKYGLLRLPTRNLAAFQVKYHWGDEADVALIAHSAKLLTQWAARHPQLVAHLNFPGIGNGRLSVGEVEPHLACLPSNVHVWKFR